MLKMLSILFGLILLAKGIMGFIPDYKPEGHLFGIFEVSATHNALSIGIGLVALLCGLSSSLAARVFFIVFGILFAGLAFLGFMKPGIQLIEGFTINPPDNYLHATLAVVCLFIGLFVREK